MLALKEWGYTPISATLLVKAIRFGAELPSRPIVITFDDGDASVYTQAFPVMRELGFRGVNYLVFNYIGTPGYLSIDQIKELSLAGWEVGSHTMTHTDLTKSQSVEWEVVQSHRSLEELLGVPVETFAYPFGEKATNLFKIVRNNYSAAMGLGSTANQSTRNILYLSRRPVMPGWDLTTFGSFLPWNSPPVP
jgi:peptidoglycan/xylan/chitin deacetylase (PgdA/CDA1 family)